MEKNAKTLEQVSLAREMRVITKRLYALDPHSPLALVPGGRYVVEAKYDSPSGLRIRVAIWDLGIPGERATLAFDEPPIEAYFNAPDGYGGKWYDHLEIAISVRDEARLDIVVVTRGRYGVSFQ